jgi:hypothetical protein
MRERDIEAGFLKQAAANMKALFAVRNPDPKHLTPAQEEQIATRKAHVEQEMPGLVRDRTAHGDTDPETYQKIRPLLQIVAEVKPGVGGVVQRTGRWVPETVNAFCARTGIGLGQIRSMSREELRAEAEIRAGRLQRETSTELSADDREKLSNLIGRDETTASFVKRTGLPISFIRQHSRLDIEHVLDNHSQHRIETR